MTDDLKAWKRSTAVRRFREIKANASRAGMGMSDMRAARAAAGYVDASADEVLRWVREAN
ncbi:hypothetical protein [Sphingopyxis indica]|uniref:Uncharacterized protein n=1 Tax=Sphingopyxis indica TaxID=436663 RepID=A0A239KP23_9SPHN|nr:hypothetical protein [Sphingopyxis indica]SNT19921.1 hypothetical protein SAMN06295955_11583 [Sphingopyxis indica]